MLLRVVILGWWNPTEWTKLEPDTLKRCGALNIFARASATLRQTPRAVNRGTTRLRDFSPKTPYVLKKAFRTPHGALNTFAHASTTLRQTPRAVERATTSWQPLRGV